MSKCFSFTASRDWCYRATFSSAGLQPTTTDLGDGTNVHCWAPRVIKSHRPALLLIHGFGASAIWQWSDALRPFLSRYNVYVPDLLFFGDSYTLRPERSESFQAECMVKLMQSMGVRRLSLVGISYGGFVGYRIAADYPELVERMVLCCAGVCLEAKDLDEGLFVVKDVNDAADLLMPQTPEKLRELVRLSFYKPQRIMPSCFLTDFIDVMCTDYLEEKRELIQCILQEREHLNLPRITQPTLIIWGEEDRIFPLELAHRLTRLLEGNSELVVIKHAGHAVNLEKTKEFCKHLKAFLIDTLPQSNSTKKLALLLKLYRYKDGYVRHQGIEE